MPLGKCKRESVGNSYGINAAKIGNAYLRWTFGEAATLFLNSNLSAEKWMQIKAKTLAIHAYKLGRAVYFLLKRRNPFDQEKCLATA